jgi:hypothetical protein
VSEARGVIWVAGRIGSLPVEKESRIGLGRRFIRDAVRQEILCAERIEFSPELVEVDGLLLDRLEDHLVADLAYAHLTALEAKLVSEADCLAAAMPEQFGGPTHDRLPLILIDINDIYHAANVSANPLSNIG